MSANLLMFGPDFEAETWSRSEIEVGFVCIHFTPNHLALQLLALSSGPSQGKQAEAVLIQSVPHTIQGLV